MSKYKLYYYNARGRAEVSRLIFAAAGQKYEDIRYQYEEWPLHAHEMPLGEIPVLEIDGIKLPQSLAIASFLAKQFRLAGRDNLEQAKIEVVVETIRDLIIKYISIRYGQNDDLIKEKLTYKFFHEELPEILHYLEILHNLEILAKDYSNGGYFFVDNPLTWADLLFYNTGENLLQLNDTCLNNYRWLKQNRAEVEKQPRIIEYLKKRSKTPF